MDSHRSISSMSSRETLRPLIMTFTIFMIWGICCGLNDVVPRLLQITLGISRQESGMLSAGTNLAYLIVPLPSVYIQKKLGVRWTYVIGFMVFAFGTIVWFIAGHYRVLWGICVSNFFMAAGNSTATNAAVSYIGVLGPSKRAEIRINLAFAIQCLATIGGSLIGRVLLNDELREGSDLRNPQIVFIVTGAVSAITASMFAFVRIPEPKDKGLEEEAARSGGSGGWTSKSLLKQHRLFFGVVVLFFFGGALSSFQRYYINYVKEVKEMSDQTSVTYLVITDTCYLSGRLIQTWIATKVKPRKLLLTDLLIYLSLFAAAIAGTTGDLSIGLICASMAVGSIITPFTTSLAMRGLGRHSKIGGALVMMSYCGGAAFGPAVGALIGATGSVRKSWYLNLAAMSSAIAFAVYVNFYRRVRREIDALSASPCSLQGRESGVEEQTSAATRLSASGSRSGDERKSAVFQQRESQMKQV